MRIAQCVLCDRALKSGARSDCQFCGVRCRVRAHRLRQAKRSRPEQDDSERLTQQIAELEARLRSVEEHRQSDAVRHAQERGELQGKLQSAEERAAKLREAAQAWKAQCKELEQASQVLQTALQQAHTMIVGMQHALQNRGDVPGQGEERTALTKELAELRQKQAMQEAELAREQLRNEALVSERDVLRSACKRLNSQIDGLTETVSRYRQEAVATTVVGGLGVLSHVMAKVAAQHGAKITPLNVAEILNPPQEEKEPPVDEKQKATKESAKTEPDRSRKEELAEQLLRGWRPDRDMLVEVMRSQLAAEYALTQVKEGKTPLQRKQSPPVERDHEAMYRALEMRKELAGKHGGASAWRYPNYELGLRLEFQLRNEQEARTERLKEEARKLQFVRNKLR
jgi:hypothetical protein